MSINATINNHKGKVVGKSGELLTIFIFGEDRTPVYEITANKDLFDVRYVGAEDYLLSLVGDLAKPKSTCWAQVGEDFCPRPAVKGSDYCAKHKKEFES